MKIIKVRKLKRNTYPHYGIEYGFYLGRKRVASAWKFGEIFVNVESAHFGNLLDTMDCYTDFCFEARNAIREKRDSFTINFN